MTSTEIGTHRTNDRTADFAYLPGLDGIRALAVISVILYHAGYPVVGGYLGVESFFVLSGFLITALLYTEWKQRGHIHIPTFWLRRARRLLPALFIMLVGTFILTSALLPSALGSLGGDALAALFYVMNWKLIAAQQSYFDAFSSPSLLQHLWSLAIEEQFYLFWPLLFGLGMRLLRPIGLLIGILAAALASAVLMMSMYDPGSDPSRIYYGTDTRAAALFIGAALALIWTPERKAALSQRWGVLLGGGGISALVGLLIAYGWMYDQHPLLYRGGFQLVSLATALVIVATTAPGARILPALLEWSPLRWIGLRSYSLYLWHWPLFTLLQPQADFSLRGWLVNIACLALTVALSAASYRFIERPIRAAGFAKMWRSLHVIIPSRLSRWDALPLAASIVLTAAIGVLFLVQLPMRATRAAISSGSTAALISSVTDTTAYQTATTFATPTRATPIATNQRATTGVASNPSVVPAAPTIPLPESTPTTSLPAEPALDAALASGLQQLLDESVANGYSPGIVFSVSMPGHASWTGASGLANRSDERAMTPTTPVRIASTSKMFTAVVVLQLVEEGTLALDTPIATWLPDSVPRADRITVRQLLQHTSGLYDYLEDRNFIEQMRRDPERVWQPQEMVDYAARFPSGALGRWDYSSTNYVLLGMLVERVTGQPLAQQIRQRIFEPLGMSQAVFLPQEGVPDTMAHGYSNGTDITDISMSFAFGTANLAMTAEDLQRFGRALFTGQLLRAETRETMMQFVSGRGQYGMPALAYGLGVMRNRLPLGDSPDGQTRSAQAITVYGHIGGYGGFRSALWYAPDSDVIIAIGLNQTLADPNDLATEVMDLVLASMGR